jgi:O-antigen/teichoic acid export membrane protein
MSKYKQLGKNTILVFFGNMGSKMISFIMLPFYTKWLSVEDYGALDNILVYVTLLGGIVALSISESIFVFPKGHSKDLQKQYFSSALFYSLICLIITGILLYGVDQILINLNVLKTITDNIVFFYLLIIAFFLQNFILQFSRSINKIRIYAISGIILTIFTTVLSFFLIPKFGLHGFFIAQFIALLISSIFTFVFAGVYKYFSIKTIKLDRYNEMIKYSIPLIPNAVMWWLVGSLNRPMLEEYLGMHANGIFAVAYKFPSLINVVFSIFIFSWQISVLEEFKKEGYELFYNKVLRLVFIFLTLLSCVLSVFSQLIITTVADEKFIDAWQLIPILSLSVLFSSISGFVGSNFSATRESKYFFYSSVWGAVASIAFNFLLIPSFGLFGACLAIVLSFVIMAISRIIYSWRFVKITNLYVYGLMIGINILVVFVLFYIDNIIFKITLYLLLLLLFFVVNRDIKDDLIMLYLKCKTRVKNLIKT